MDIDYREDNRWKVYVHINKVNGKMYVGQTCQKKPSYRFGKNGSGYKACAYFYNAIQKYGWDNFDHEVIAENLTHKEADLFEKGLIEKLNTRDPKFGYNIAIGGNKGLGNFNDPAFSKKVYRYSLDGIYIDEFPSEKEVSRVLGEKYESGCISKCCCGEIDSCYGYMWRFEKYDKIKPHQEDSRITRDIYEFDLDGKLISYFKDMKAIKREYPHLPKNYSKEIRRCITHQIKQAYERIWLVETEIDDIQEYVKANKTKGRKTIFDNGVQAYDIKGNVICSFESLNEFKYNYKTSSSTMDMLRRGYNFINGLFWFCGEIPKDELNKRIKEIAIDKCNNYLVCLNNYTLFTTKKDAAKYSNMNCGTFKIYFSRIHDVIKKLGTNQSGESLSWITLPDYILNNYDMDRLIDGSFLF